MARFGAQRVIIIIIPAHHTQVVPCLALYDTMRHINSDVATVGFGACFGMSGFLLAVGKKVWFA